MPQSMKNQGALVWTTVYSRKTANPHQIRVKGITRMSLDWRRTPVRGLPLHSRLSFPCRKGWTSACASFHMAEGLRLRPDDGDARRVSVQQVALADRADLAGAEHSGDR